MKFFYKIIIIFSIIIFLTIIYLVLIVTWKIPYNNLYLKIFQESFNTFINPIHPKESNLLAEAAELGNWSDGTYCQFIVGEFRSSSLSKEAIRQFYFKESMSSGVYFIDGINDNDTINNPWHEWKEKYLKNYKPKENENIYLVWMSEDKSPNGDIRCD
jgi:hypothetical protein